MRGLDQIQRAEPLVERVLEQLIETIVTGHFEPGEKLVETRLAEQLGVSRGPIREAFRRLEQIGLVEKVPYRGTVVATLTSNDIAELHAVRGPLEGLAARILASHQDPELLAPLTAILDEMRGGVAPARMIELDLAFHDRMIELSNHKLLSEVWNTVSIRLRRFLLLKRERLYRSLNQAAALHEPILAAIVAGDADQAETMARHHVDEAARQHLSQALSTAIGPSS